MEIYESEKLLTVQEHVWKTKTDTIEERRNNRIIHRRSMFPNKVRSE